MKLLFSFLMLFCYSNLNAKQKIDYNEISKQLQLFDSVISNKFKNKEPDQKVYIFEITSIDSNCIKYKINYSYFLSDYYFLRFYNQYIEINGKILLIKNDDTMQIRGLPKTSDWNKSDLQTFLKGNNQRYHEKRKYEIKVNTCNSVSSIIQGVQSRNGMSFDTIRIGSTLR